MKKTALISNSKFTENCTIEYSNVNSAVMQIMFEMKAEMSRFSLYIKEKFISYNSISTVGP